MKKKGKKNDLVLIGLASLAVVFILASGIKEAIERKGFDITEILLIIALGCLIFILIDFLMKRKAR